VTVIAIVLKACGNAGSIIANDLSLKGKKVRVVGRDAGRLQRFVGKDAEAFTADLTDVAPLDQRLLHLKKLLH
jgi:uncharacterized protein YbjT (DUF2867 family)